MLKFVLVFVILVAACLAVAIADWLVLGRSIFADSAPDYSRYFLQRTGFALVCGAGAAVLATAGDPIRMPASGVSSAVATLAGIAFLAMAAFVMVDDPAKFNLLAMEDGLFEWLSVVAFAGATVLTLATISASRRSRRGTPLQHLLLLMMALVFFIITMEEVSWMQRVFQFSTPAWMDERNLQHEFNFHNMATNPAENAFYLGTFFSLVYFPFVFAASPFLQKYAMLHALLPGTSTMAIGVLTTTFSIEMWNIFGVQLAFFFALTAIAMTAFSLWRNGERISALTAFSATVALVAFQAMDFVSGPNFVRYWDDTELKELVVALGLLLLAAEIFLRASGASGVKPPASDARTGNAEE